MARRFIVYILPFLALMGVVIFLFITAAMLSLARAHDWYPLECCSQVDCAPVDWVTMSQTSGFLPGTPLESSMVVSTKHGMAIVPLELQRRESKDGRMHACIRDGRVICIFVPPGM